MAYFRSNLVSSSPTPPGPGSVTVDSIIDGGQISHADPNGSYDTVTFNNISNYKYVFIKVYSSVSGTDYEDYQMIETSIIGSGVEVGFALQTPDVVCTLTTTSFSTTRYSGAWTDIYCDIAATDNDIFDSTNL